MQAFELSCPLSNTPPAGKIAGWNEELSELKRKVAQH